VGWVCNTPEDRTFQSRNVKARNLLGNLCAEGRFSTRIRGLMTCVQLNRVYSGCYRHGYEPSRLVKQRSF
jgi:hypothetical protein